MNCAAANQITPGLLGVGKQVPRMEQAVVRCYSKLLLFPAFPNTASVADVPLSEHLSSLTSLATKAKQQAYLHHIRILMGVC